MKRVRKTHSYGSKLKSADVSDIEEYADCVDPTSSDFIYDEVDEHYEKQERQGFEKIARLKKKLKTVAQEEVLGVASSSDEEEAFSKRRGKNKNYSQTTVEPLPPLDSDLEGEREEDENEESVTLKWGKKKSSYYNADYVDEDWDNADESDAEKADLEEQEALAIQQRMTQQLEDADFGLEFIHHLKDAEKVKESKNLEEKIGLNLSQLSKREKLKVLCEESPELLELVDDFKMQLSELENTICPLMNVIKSCSLPASPGVDYVKAKYNLILSYCTQIGYYFVLKSKRISVQNHPVIKRLVQFRSLLHQLEDTRLELQSEIDGLIKMVENGQHVNRADFVHPVAPPKKKLRILRHRPASSTTDKEDKSADGKKPAKSSDLTRDEHGALDFYNAVRKRRDDGISSGEDESVGENAPAAIRDPKEDTAVETDEAGKRAINYQIAKNKGLTPHRPKEQRNPRVKHRMKFRKATIRRKGAIREPRKEQQRYGGEISGIKATVIRSVKLK